MSRLRMTLTSALACLSVVGAIVLSPLLAQGPSSATGDEAAIKEVVRKYVDAARPGTRRPSSPCSRPTPTSSSRTARGGRVRRDGPRHARIVAEVRRAAKHHRRVGPAALARCGDGRRTLHANGPRRGQGSRDVDDDRPETWPRRLADRRDPEHAAGDAGDSAAKELIMVYSRSRTRSPVRPRRFASCPAAPGSGAFVGRDPFGQRDHEPFGQGHEIELIAADEPEELHR